jgi:hypothetical protein
MKSFLSLWLTFILTLTSVAPAFSQSKSSSASTCEDGECIPGLLDKLEKLGSLYQKQCLPKGIKESEILKYHEENGFTEECWKYITEIKNLEDQLMKHQNRLEARLGCENGECHSPNSPGEDLNSQLAALNKVEKEVSCTPEKKAAVVKQCPADMNCAMMSTALTTGGYLAELVVPKNWKPAGCNLGDDSCITQLATGFLKAAFTFFEAAWDILKFIGNKTSQAMTDFWNWVTDAEDHSSTSQLALAKASEDKGVFDMLVDDFPGTMKKIWQGLVASIKEWLKTDMFCQKWSGTPHFSTCLKPTESFDCLPCKTMINGMCAITGAIVAEIVPAFFTGGLVTAAKYGASGATKIAKLFKVSNTTVKALKETKIAKTAIQASTKIDDVLKVTKGIKAAKAAVQIAMAAIKTYMLSPTRKLLKTSLGALTSLAKKGSAYVAVTPAGKILVFSAKTLKTTAKVVIYPIDNPMIAASFKAGQRSFDKVFKLASPKLVVSTGVAAKIVTKGSAVETSMAKLEVARIAAKPQAAEVARLELEVFNHVSPVRKDLLTLALKDGDDLDDIIRHLYPELEYGTLAKNLGPDKVVAAERELWAEISKISDESLKDALFKKFQVRVAQGEARGKIVVASANYEKVIENSKLPKEKRFEEAMVLIKREPTSASEKTKLARTLQEAHLAAPDNGVFEYTWSELREKYRILTEGGFTPTEADDILRAGLAGRPPVRELIQPGNTLFSGFAEDIVQADYLTRREELFDLLQPKNNGDFIETLFSEKPRKSPIQENFESLYFIDYQHSAGDLNDILMGGNTIEKVTMSQKYEKQAFENFKAARETLLEKKPDINKETLMDIHKHMMKEGVEDVLPINLGVIRDGSWGGNVPYSQPINQKILEEVKSNKFLTWVEEGSLGNESYYGKIMYPNAGQVTKEVLDLIRTKNPSLVLKVEGYQNNIVKPLEVKKALLKNNPLVNDYRNQLVREVEELNVVYQANAKLRLELTRELVNSLTDDVMDWFTRERTLIGEINSPEKLDEYVNLLAKFQRDLVSIHPLANGNGRSTRELMNYALMKEGFPPARVIDTSSDIYNSLDDWKRIIKHGILSSDFLMDDLLERLKFGLPIENSIDLVTPYTRPPVKMTLKGDKKVPLMEGVEYIDPRLYREIVKRLIKKEPGLQAELTANPVKAWDKINAKADEVFANNNIYYKHPKNGIERVEIGYVDQDFKVLYGKSSFDNQELYDFKMKSWYSNDVNWRGLASKHSVTSEDEIVDMFKELNSHMASNSVLGKTRGNSSAEAIRKAALEDFEKFNDDVFTDGLVNMARDHSETGPMYGISYGYSTSKNREVGKAFSMGAMVVAPYGQHKLPELQALLKSRVLVGARKSMKDVDLGRLKQVRPEFSYKYGRQQEVMGVGASDPDAITIIQTINAEGGVDLTYLRNPKKSDEIWVVKGDIDPDAIPTAEQIVKTMTLSR